MLGYFCRMVSTLCNLETASSVSASVDIKAAREAFYGICDNGRLPITFVEDCCQEKSGRQDISSQTTAEDPFWSPLSPPSLQCRPQSIRIEETGESPQERPVAFEERRVVAVRRTYIE